MLCKTRSRHTLSFSFIFATENVGGSAFVMASAECASGQGANAARDLGYVERNFLAYPNGNVIRNSALA